MTQSNLSKIDPNLAVVKVEGGQRWFDMSKFPIEGMGWPNESEPYTRLPDRAKGVVVDAVWELSRHSAGVAIRFISNATVFNARWTLRYERLAMNHMPATGMSGLDLYVKHENRWRWIGIGIPNTVPTSETMLMRKIDEGGEREFMLFLPLYNGVSKLEIGIPADQPENVTIRPAPPRTQKPVLYYGTSITQGGCMSRSGMSYEAIIHRHLDYPHINLGFSGSGRLEPEVATFIAELDPSIFVIDALPNNDAKGAAVKLEPFIRTLRKARPNTPIVLVENVIYGGSYLVTERRNATQAINAVLHDVYNKLQAEGMKGLTLVSSKGFLGAPDEEEGTVDGSHPTDLGFTLIAKVLEPVIKSLL